MASKGLTFEDFCNGGDQAPEEPLSANDYKRLPKHLLIQLNNLGKDNKNSSVFAFFSELVAQGVFVTVEASFLMVGHTHEDVDAMFSKVSGAVCHSEIETLHGLMASFWMCEVIHPVPSFIQEVANYKAYSKPFLDKIDGHSTPIAF